MAIIAEDQLEFNSPDDWQVSQFDEWSFYRHQFMKIGAANLNCSKCEAGIRCAQCNNKKAAGTKGIDFLAIEPNTICWLIEVKDYRKTLKSNFEFLADEVALKVRDTLACLVAAQANANDQEEKKAAISAVRSSRFRIVLHLEQRTRSRPINQAITQRANVLQKLRQLVKSIDPNPLVIDMTEMNNMNWTVRQVGPAH